MPLFPLFIDLANRPCLIVGGGQVAARKAEKLSPYGAKLTMVAPEFLPELELNPDLTLLRRPYCADDLTGMALVIAATDDPAVNHAVSRDCKARNIPINVVDDRDACTFLFPCLVQKGDLSVGISTGGASPTAAIWLKERVEELVPQDFDHILRWLEGIRPMIKQTIPAEQTRAALFGELFRLSMELGRPLTDAELEEVLS